MAATQTQVPDGALLLEQHYDRAAGTYFYTITRSGSIISARQAQEGRLLFDGDRTEMLRSRRHDVATVVIQNLGGRPRFFTRRGRFNL